MRDFIDALSSQPPPDPESQPLTQVAASIRTHGMGIINTQIAGGHAPSNPWRGEDWAGGEREREMERGKEAAPAQTVVAGQGGAYL